MKSILMLVIVGAFSVLTTQAQITDQQFNEQERKIKEIENQLQNLRIDLQKFNKQHRTGTALMIGGFALTTFGIVGATYVDCNSDISSIASIIGGVASLTGLYLQLDSYKFLGGRGSTFIGNGGAGIRIRL